MLAAHTLPIELLPAMQGETQMTTEPEEKLDHALKLFVAHCGGDVGRATSAQREKFDEALIEFAASQLDLAAEA